MKKGTLCSALADGLKNRPVFAVRYRVSTAVYRGRLAKDPERVLEGKGTHKIDPIAVFAALATCKLCIKLLVRLIKRKKEKKKHL